MKIKNIIGREVLDSRGNPTVEVDVILKSGVMGRATIPSGASTGSKEALELRDNDERYHGKGVLKAVNNVNTIIRESLIGEDASNQREIDMKLINLDGTPNKEKLGANAILGVSLAVLKAVAMEKQIPLYKAIGNGNTLPYAMMNIINGGEHADNNLDFQEFMIIVSRDTMKERVRIGAEVFHTLRKVLKEKGHNTNVGDEGGFAPNLSGNKEALDVILEAVKRAGYIPGTDVNIALDVAASEFYENGKYVLKSENRVLTSDEMIEYYVDLVNNYPIVSIEDPLSEFDYDGFEKMTRILQDKVMIVGDDLFVTNKEIFKKCIDSNIGNAILLKANQIGTVTEMLETIELAKHNNYKTIISHRSGETEDTFIAHFAVGLDLGYIKTGSLSRTDRTSKYNELMRIEEELNN